MLALMTMIIDHTGHIFNGYVNADLLFMRVIGRMSFPIFAFLISEGCRYTRDIKKYMLRLFVFAMISHLCLSARIIYVSVYGETGGLFAGLPVYNVFFTLLLGAASVYGYQQIQKLGERFLYEYAPSVDFAWKLLSLLPFFAAMITADYFGTDYGAVGIWMIFAAYVANDKSLRMLAIFSGIVILQRKYFLTPFTLQNLRTLAPYSASLSLLFIYLYNGEKGRHWKWFFYLAYPGHLVMLGVLWFLLVHQIL
jgi:hypothetical protein